jgi:hypothetical protein
MPPNPQLLDRDRARATSALVLADVLPNLTEIVDEGTNLLARLNQTAWQGGEPRSLHTVLLLLLRHVVEQADAVDELFRAGCYLPARLQARSVVEAQMQMLYMVGRRNPFHPSPLPQGVADPHPRDAAGAPLSGQALADALDLRAQVYLVAELRRRIAAAQALELPAAQADAQRRTGSASVSTALADVNTQAGIAGEIAAMQAMLQQPEKAPADAALTAARTGKFARYDPPWYSLDGGPTSAAGLARSVGDVTAYELFYSEASRTMHATDIEGQLVARRRGGGQVLAPLRESEDLHHFLSVYITKVVTAFEIAITEIRPGDRAQWQQWTQRWVAPLR